MVSRTALQSAIAVALLLVGLSVSAQEIPEPVDGLLDKWNDARVKSSPASSWSTEHVDTERNVGYNVSLAIDPKTGDKYISYYDGTNGDLWLARTGAPVGNCGYQNNWHCQALDTNGIRGKYSSIAVGGPGTHAKVYITYYDATWFDLRLIEGSVNRQTGEFVFEAKILYTGYLDGEFLGRDEYAGKSSAIALDDNGTPHVAFQYLDKDDLKWGIYATKVPINTGNCGPESDWQCDDFEGLGSSFSPDFISIDVDALGFPHIAYYDENVARGRLCFSYNDTICFDYLTVTPANSGKYMSVFVEDDGTAHLAYHNASSEKLEYTVFEYPVSQDIYSIDTVGSYGQPAGISIAQDGNGFPVIAYQYRDHV